MAHAATEPPGLDVSTGRETGRRRDAGDGSIRDRARYAMGRDYHDALPAIVRDHLVCRVVDRLIPVTQKHDIEGLVMGVA